MTTPNVTVLNAKLEARKIEVVEPGFYIQVGNGPLTCMWTELTGPAISIHIPVEDAGFLADWLKKAAGI